MSTRRREVMGMVDKEATPLLAAMKGFGHKTKQQQQQQHDPVDNVQRNRKSVLLSSSSMEGGDSNQQQQQQQIYKTQSSSSSSSSHHVETKKEEGPKLSITIGSFITGLIQDVREFIFSSTTTTTDRNGLSSIDQNKIYYEDHFNDLTWNCTVGTLPTDGIWYNQTDYPGIVMSCMVWLLVIYSCFTITLLANHNHLSSIIAGVYCTICFLALACHVKTSLTDPGAIPFHTAVPIRNNNSSSSSTYNKSRQQQEQQQYLLCMACNTYKPPKSHHCRICNRCIAGMDHHCPWMNNCVGTANHKHFLLFLIYIWVASTYALIVFSINYFFCSSEECIFPSVLVHLVRLMSILCIGALLFTTNMLMNEIQAIITGIGTIDRMKRKAKKTLLQSDDEPMLLTDIFGMGPNLFWFLPIDPVFDDYDRVMGYSTTPRLLREKAFDTPKRHATSPTPTDGFLHYFRDI